MSAIAGVLRFDERGIEPTLSETIDVALHPYGPNASGRHTQCGLLLMHRALSITREDANDVQPHTTPRGHILTWDGRLDNRRDLLCRLSDRLPAAAPDVALVGACYDAQGEDAFASLVGDWSLALWDSVTCRLILACDYAANRPLYYACGPNAIHWSTSLSDLVCRLSRDTALDYAYLGDALTFLPPGELTPYRGIRSVPAAHLLSWSRSGEFRRKRFWTLRIGTIRYKRPDDYGDHLLHLFSAAVRSRIRSTAPVSAELSGGLDSSSVICMADLCLYQDPGLCPGITSVSYIADEERFIREVEAHRGRPGHHLPMAAPTPDDGAAFVGIEPRDQRSNRLRRLFEAVREADSRVLLTGQGGDSVMGNHLEYPDAIAETLSSGRILTSLRTTRRQALATQDTMWRVLRSVATLYLPSWFADQHSQRALLRRISGGRANAVHTGSLTAATRQTFLTTDAVAQRWLDALSAHNARVRSIAAASRRTLVSDILMWTEDQRLRTPEFWTHGYRTHPFLHRPLVEYALAIPSEVLCPPGVPRALMRSTFGFVPRRILNRFSKGTPEPHVLRDLRADASTWLQSVDSMQLVINGVIDPTLLRARLAQIIHGNAPGVTNVALILETERWLQHRLSVPQEPARHTSWDSSIAHSLKQCLT